MILKFIDARGHTHLRECTQLSYLGMGEHGWDEAIRLDGEPGEILNYDSTDAEFPTRYFVIYPPNAPRRVIATACAGAWLMNDRGDTIENLTALPDPPRVIGVEATPVRAARELD
jgi:hypothetical protein